MEIIERNMELLKLQKNYEDAEVRNHQNAEEIAKLKEQYRALSNELKSYKQELCGKCEESLLVIENLERDKNRLTLEITDLSDSTEAIEEEYMKIKSQVNELKKINENLKTDNKARKDRELILQQSKKKHKRYYKRGWKLWYDLNEEYRRILRKISDKKMEKQEITKKNSFLECKLLVLKEKLEKAKIESLNDLKDAKNRLLIKEAHFESRQESYLNQISDLKRELEEINVKHF